MDSEDATTLCEAEMEKQLLFQRCCNTLVTTVCEDEMDPTEKLNDRFLLHQYNTHDSYEHRKTPRDIYYEEDIHKFNTCQFRFIVGVPMLPVIHITNAITD